MRPLWFPRLLMALAGGLYLATSSASAGPFYYSGDMNGVDALGNVTNGAYGTGVAVYDSFTVSGPSVIVTALFTNNIMDNTTSTADWSIRSGVSTGNGGTVIGFGTGVAATQTATGRSLFGLNEYSIRVSGLSVLLTPGTYWFNVTPYGQGTNNGFDAQTTTNGSTNPYFSDIDNSLSFVPASTQAPPGEQFTSFSDGVLASPAASPEPASLVLMATAFGGLWLARGRLRRQAAS